MGNIYKNQGNLKIELTYNVLPATLDKVWIKYMTPEGEIGTFPTEAIHNAPGLSYYYLFPAGESLSDYGPAGTWRFWLYIELTDGNPIPGEPYEVRIYNEGT
jgi:hypothetical protein